MFLRVPLCVCVHPLSAGRLQFGVGLLKAEEGLAVLSVAASARDDAAGGVAGSGSGWGTAEGGKGEQASEGADVSEDGGALGPEGETAGSTDVE